MPIGNRVIIKMQKAGKQYVCVLCGDLIEAGEHYLSATAEHEGKFLSIKACILHRYQELYTKTKEMKGVN